MDEPSKNNGLNTAAANVNEDGVIADKKLNAAVADLAVATEEVPLVSNPVKR